MANKLMFLVTLALVCSLVAAEAIGKLARLLYYLNKPIMSFKRMQDAAMDASCTL
jgi:hypothetical protein